MYKKQPTNPALPLRPDQRAPVIKIKAAPPLAQQSLTALLALTREVSLHQFRALLLMKSGDPVLMCRSDQLELQQHGLITLAPHLQLTEKAGVALQVWTEMLLSDLRDESLV